MGIFSPRANYKPFEYPEVLQFINAINQSFWVHSEVDFTADIQDFHTRLDAVEKNAVKHALLAIAQIEVNVKTFWGQLYTHLPKPEFNGLGSCFAECEFRHSEAYSQLLQVLGYNDAFRALIEVPVIKERMQYLSEATRYIRSEDRGQYLLSLILFSILIENVSLFSQFAILVSFTRFQGLMKNVSNIIAWTSIDEQVHANAGIYLVKTICEEYPELLTKERIELIYQMVRQSIVTEGHLLDWIFEKGEINNVSKQQLLHFMQYRADESLSKIGLEPQFAVSSADYSSMQWFEEEIFANSLDDFFAKRPTAYTKHDKSITGADLF